MQNETTSTDAGLGVTSAFAPLEHTPILAGTMTGTIYNSGTAIQTFTVSASGSFTFSDIGSPSPKVTSGSLNTTTGELVLNWNASPSSNHCVVSYEYNLECNQDLPEINQIGRAHV